MCPDVDCFLTISFNTRLHLEWIQTTKIVLCPYVLNFIDNVHKIKRVGALRVNKITASILTLPELRVNNIYQEEIANAFLRYAVHKRFMSFTQSTLIFSSFLWKSLSLKFIRLEWKCVKYGDNFTYGVK